ncbi:MAG TPA: protein kinase [Acidobacteriota bacterium]|nr:protein kinase [Acidobacteriota bacterium]
MYLLTAGTLLGRFKLLNLLGKGGMGEVWRAQDPRLGREVAIKLLPPELAKDPDLHIRFERESKILAALNNSNIAQIYEAGEEIPQGDSIPIEPEKVSFLVMELIEGRSLSQILSSSRIPVGLAARLARQIARALAAAHKAGIVHRDLKPANIMVTPENQVKVLDFGLARPMGGAFGPVHTLPEVTIPGMVMGTAAFLSPEQVKGNPADLRTDIWAFGCVLYQMLAGRRPFDSNSVPEILAGILRDDPVELSRLNPSLPPALTDLVKRCLLKDPDKRPQSAQEISLALKNIIEQMRGGGEGRVDSRSDDLEQGTPGQVTVETINRYLKTIRADFPQLSAKKRGAAFVEVQHRGASIGMLVTSKSPGSDMIAFILPLNSLPAGNLQAYYKRLLVLSNGHTDIAQFAVDQQNQKTNLTCVRMCSHMDYKEFLYTLDAMANVSRNIALPLSVEFR